MIKAETIEVPLGVYRQEVIFSGRVNVTWPSRRPDQQVLLAGDLLIEDADTGADIGATTLALLAVKAGDAFQGATGFMRLCLLRLSNPDGDAVTEKVDRDPNIDNDALRQQGIGIMNGFYVAEFWYAIAEMTIQEPLPALNPPTNEIEDEVHDQPTV